MYCIYACICVCMYHYRPIYLCMFLCTCMCERFIYMYIHFDKILVPGMYESGYFHTSFYSSRGCWTNPMSVEVMIYINSFIHSGDLYSASSDTTTQRRSQPSHGPRIKTKHVLRWLF